MNCACVQFRGQVSCSWINWRLLRSIAFSAVSLSLSVLRSGPIAWIEEESQLEENSNIYSLAVKRSSLTFAKIILYIFGFIANISGSCGFLLLCLVSSSPRSLVLLPLVLFQITQPKWLAFMFHQIRCRYFVQIGGMARHCGKWWIYFLAVSPIAYTVFFVFCFGVNLITEEKILTSAWTRRPLGTGVIYFQKSTNCPCIYNFAANIDPRRESAFYKIYPECKICDDNDAKRRINKFPYILSLKNYLRGSFSWK